MTTPTPKPDGGPAFPVPMHEYPQGQITNEFPGMTLRDYFAAKAVVGYMSSNSLHDKPLVWAKGISELAYLLADAMIAERSKTT